MSGVLGSGIGVTGLASEKNNEAELTTTLIVAKEV